MTRPGFDLFTVMRSRRLGNASFDRMVASINSDASDAERRQRRDDYLSDLMDECEAAGLIEDTSMSTSARMAAALAITSSAARHIEGDE